MTIFQNSVLQKYLKTQDEKTIDEAYCQFSRYFHNTEIQQNIRNSKEEQFQEGFLRELFVKILGYTLNPQPDFNLTTELKNEKGAKKTDGAILKNAKALAVIELKGTNTKDLDKVNNQAFNYKNNHSDCIYVITSNFEKLRFFIHNAVAYLEFNLFTLTEEEFKILWLCLNAENLLAGVPAQIKQDSIIVEENVTKQLYKDYSTFKHQLWQNICKNQPDLDKLLLFKKTQKLLDRFLFVFFAEDSGLLPPNSISAMVKRYEQLIKLDAQKPLYDIFKQFFNYINTGRKGETAQDDIFAYNGGLFLPDKLLDGLIIDDELLKPHVLTMTGYNFESDIDVNILGHIFENSLSEIENVTAQLEGKTVDKSKTKRKKDGVFYTPKYITKYIVENTVGKLCEEKKTELSIVDKEYAKGRKNRRKKIVQTLYDNLQEYRNWLLEITICDPACGSGAFLNQALEFLIAEHAYIDELEAVLLESSIVFQDVSDHVLEKNIFGVDINEESIDIAKLSLWLRTAQRGRKLTSLNNNIKCGNSLIDDPEVAGEKAFNWEKEFPQVFENGGFDVVVGNPPYVDMRKMLTEEIKFFKKKYLTASNRLNLFGLFVEHSFNIMRKGSEYGMIIHRNLIRSNEYEKCRELILNNTELNSILSFKNGLFEGVTGEMTILTFSKKNKPNLKNEVRIYNYENKIDKSFHKSIIKQEIFNKCLGKRFNVYITKEKANVLDKLNLNIVLLGKISDTLQGIIAGDEKKYVSKNKLSEEYKAIIRGRDIKRYSAKDHYEFIYYIEGTKVLTRSRKKENFECPEKILTQHVSGGINAYLDKNRLYYMQTINGTIVTDKNYNTKYILVLLNSVAISFYYDNIFNLGAEFTTAVAIKNLDLIPIKNIPLLEQQPFIEKSDLMLSLNKDLQTEKNNFLNTLQEEKGIKKITKKLDTFYKMEYDVFKKELAKQKVKISLGNENNEWREYFNTTTQKTNELQTKINQTDKEIDKMVYKLYELTPEEIEIVENSVK
ncbi:N-6 DNA methylase [Candidatus Venteria ishoeyi]|uniref:Eco57I restriction-modification methylase domain-containing protein n=1 Tax=Candidatus Venteria ishoeyi TaxID=1899563 RepID=UPI0025A609F4|nr:N-6 DNA methylase [Candidatus Venteria ishoeyi]MDM8545704.1 N-6 DNA methylase [Candidatus Venteria ishoeyi]